MSEGCSALARCMENIPIIGHFVAIVHACAKNKKAHAERAGLKATLGICMCICNFPTECVDECARKKSPKLQSFSLTHRPEWMKKYNRYTLRQICIPGSHQSTTYFMKKKLNAVPMSTGWAQCQQLGIRAQLHGGIRFLDLRIMSDSDGEIWTHHNVVTCVTLREVFEIVRSFINDYPTEIVGISIANDGKNVDWSACRSLLNEYLGQRLIMEHMRDMLIGDIVDQGKNIFITGVPNVAYTWRTVQSYWPNKQWPDELRADMESTITDLAISKPHTIYWYKAECTPGTHMIVRGVGGVPGAAVSSCADEKFEFIEDMAAAVNLMIYDILKDLSQIPFNILSTDYVQDEIVDRIIELNSQTSEHDETFMLSPDQSMPTSGYSENIHHANFSRSSNAAADHSSLTLGSSAYGDNPSISFSRNSTQSSRMEERALGRAARAHNVSTRSSNVTLSHNTTSGTLSGQFEMPQRKAPAVEIKETTM